MRRPFRALVAVIVLLAIPLEARQGANPSSWLDRPLAPWSEPSGPVPRAIPGDEPRNALQKRCQLSSRQGTAGEHALTDAGWIPFLHFDRQIVERDVEIVGGMIAADGMCRPAQFNVFVFVGGRFAGTLSPQAMTSRLDASIGAVRLAADDTISAEFARYRNEDPLCCPSAHVTVQFRIDRSGPRPLVVPAAIRTTRG